MKRLRLAGFKRPLTQFVTHWHLVSSVFIAPLLLLRSRASMEAGVRWFLKDWFGFDDYNQWPRRMRLYWLIVMASITGGLTYCFAIDCHQRAMIGGLGSAILGHATWIGALSICLAAALAISLATAISGAGVLRSNSPQNHSAALVGSAAGFVAGVFAAVSPGLAAVGGACGSLLFLLVVFAATKGAAGVILGLPVAAGIAVRALICRLSATFINARTGVRLLPENWRESTLLVDLTLPPELMPGIRDKNSLFALDGVLKIFFDKRNLATRFLSIFLAICFFLPAFLYRLNIKATVWFWWPLAYLLKPAPAASAEGVQRQAMCWPWSNPVQRLLILLSIGQAAISQVLHSLVATSRIEFSPVTSLPLSVRVSLGLGWARLAPWHGALWIIAVSGAGMLLLAGNACSHHTNGNWSQYRQIRPLNIRIMTTLSRVRQLATVSLLVMSLGALLLQDRTWMECLGFPGSWMTALEHFYQLHP